MYRGFQSAYYPQPRRGNSRGGNYGGYMQNNPRSLLSTGTAVISSKPGSNAISSIRPQQPSKPMVSKNTPPTNKSQSISNTESKDGKNSTPEVKKEVSSPKTDVVSTNNPQSKSTPPLTEPPAPPKISFSKVSNDNVSPAPAKKPGMTSEPNSNVSSDMKKETNEQSNPPPAKQMKPGNRNVQSFQSDSNTKGSLPPPSSSGFQRHQNFRHSEGPHKPFKNPPQPPHFGKQNQPLNSNNQGGPNFDQNIPAGVNKQFKGSNFNRKRNVQGESSFNSQQFGGQNYGGQYEDSPSPRKPLPGGRRKLFVAGLPPNTKEEELKKMFDDYGSVEDLFIQKEKWFAFITMDSKSSAEKAKANLDGKTMGTQSRPIRIRFASLAAVVKVLHLPATVTNELLEDGFSRFGDLESAVVACDDKGKSLNYGLVEFKQKKKADACIKLINEGCYVMTGDVQPISVEPVESKDEEEGLSDNNARWTYEFDRAREYPPRFIERGSFEMDICLKWKSQYAFEKQQRDNLELQLKESRDRLRLEIDDMYKDHQAWLLKQELQQREEALKKLEMMRQSDSDRRRMLEAKLAEQSKQRDEQFRRREEEFKKQQEELRMRSEYRRVDDTGPSSFQSSAPSWGVPPQPPIPNPADSAIPTPAPGTYFPPPNQYNQNFDDIFDGLLKLEKPCEKPSSNIRDSVVEDVCFYGVNHFSVLLHKDVKCAKQIQKFVAKCASNSFTSNDVFSIRNDNVKKTFIFTFRA